jgi:fused signal recognition particle receptor
MEELSKIKRVMKKVLDYSPNQTYLVLDGNTGQNAIVQAEEFGKVTEVSGLIITKLDGTAKGGVIFQICSNLKFPVKYIGVGESIDDLQNFDPKLFISAIFESE